jgi:hypothetical protein
MLIGFSGESGPVVVRGISKKAGKDYATSFGRYPFPGLIDLDEFIGPDPSAEPKQLEGFWWERSRINVNWDKRHLDSEEAALLRNWTSKIEKLV